MTYYWERQMDGTWRPPPGQDLAAMRRGLGREAGEVPQMWGLYSNLTGDGRVTNHLRAEHEALALFGLHQQSVKRHVHETGRGVGDLARAVLLSGRFSEEAVTQRFVRAAAAQSIGAVAHHLRGLIQEAKTLGHVPTLDYTRLASDLAAWQDPLRLTGVRRRWGLQFHSNRPKTDSGEHS
ncbi:type I-E CRISPR-associated protein Cse2/CasB [Tessaracoccus sp. Z1128]